MVQWTGIPGMLWSRVLPEIQRYACLDRPPDVLLLRVGGNDLCLRASRKLIRDVKWDFLQLRVSFPDTVIVWSDIIGRVAWRGARLVECVNKARIKDNKAVAKFVVCNGGLVVRHCELERDIGLFLRGDEVHLSAVGIDMWFLVLQEGLQWALCLWRVTHA